MPDATVQLDGFRAAFRSFQAEWSQAMEDGATVEDLIGALEQEGVILPAFVRQLL